MICSKHPKYKGIRRPQADCLDCHIGYFENSGDPAASVLRAIRERFNSLEDRATSANSSAQAALYVANYGGRR